MYRLIRLALIAASRSYSENWSENWQQHGRKLLKPEEVLALNERTAVTFLAGAPPICTTLVRYYEEDLGSKPASVWPVVRAMFDAVVLLASAALVAAALSGLASEGGGARSSGSADPFQEEFWRLK